MEKGLSSLRDDCTVLQTIKLQIKLKLQFMHIQVCTNYLSIRKKYLPHILIVKMYDQDEVFHSCKEKEMLQETFHQNSFSVARVHLLQILSQKPTFLAHLSQFSGDIQL